MVWKQYPLNRRERGIESLVVSRQDVGPSTSYAFMSCSYTMTWSLLVERKTAWIIGAEAGPDPHHRILLPHFPLPHTRCLPPILLLPHCLSSNSRSRGVRRIRGFTRKWLRNLRPNWPAAVSSTSST